MAGCVCLGGMLHSMNPGTEERLQTLMRYAAFAVGILVVAALVVFVLSLFSQGATSLQRFLPNSPVQERPVPQTVSEKRALLEEVDALAREGESIPVAEKEALIQALEDIDEDEQPLPTESERMKMLETLQSAE